MSRAREIAEKHARRLMSMDAMVPDMREADRIEAAIVEALEEAAKRVGFSEGAVDVILSMVEEP